MVLLKLNNLFYETAFDAVGADIYFTAFAVDLYSDFLEIRHKPAFIEIVRVTYVMSYHRFFSAYFTFFAHITPPSFFPAIGIN